MCQQHMSSDGVHDNCTVSVSYMYMYMRVTHAHKHTHTHTHTRTHIYICKQLPSNQSFDKQISSHQKGGGVSRWGEWVRKATAYKYDTCTLIGVHSTMYLVDPIKVHVSYTYTHTHTVVVDLPTLATLQSPKPLVLRDMGL